MLPLIESRGRRPLLLAGNQPQERNALSLAPEKGAPEKEDQEKRTCRIDILKRFSRVHLFTRLKVVEEQKRARKMAPNLLEVG